MRFGLIALLMMLSSVLLVSCGSDDESQGNVGEPSAAKKPPAKTVEIIKEVTVERTVALPRAGSSEKTVVSGQSSEVGDTREALPGPAVPGETDISRTVGETATLDNGNSVTVFSGTSGVPAEDSVYKPREGMDFFVIEAEVCVSESVDEPSYFTPREFKLLKNDTVRRMASVPTKLPALRGSTVDLGECNRGYITFQIDNGEEPRSVVYEGSSVIEWKLEEG
ncbi:hypothetical protein BH24ACT22_BH24ACT22_06550 [soil metagenome]